MWQYRNNFKDKPMTTTDTGNYYWRTRELAVIARTTVAALTREAGLSETVVSRWKSGKTQPTTRTWNKITAAAEVLRQRNVA